MNNTKIWETAKTDLKHQMTDATFQWLSPSTFHSIAGGNGTGLDIWTIDAKTPAARDWLQARLLKTIHKALARHLPSPKFSLRFIAGDSPPPSPSAPTLNPADFINPHATTDQEFIQNINFTKLWFQKGGSGFDRLAK
ncbi:MAG: hypothetical protein GY805_35880, partial [Chloroflexi bacterium]|nr:hypothetical protein [Chloroflexota bacterium]